MKSASAVAPFDLERLNHHRSAGSAMASSGRSDVWYPPAGEMLDDKDMQLKGETYISWSVNRHLPLKARASILVVDDDPMNFDLLEDTFGSTYNVVNATDGRSALEMASRDLPDVILLDVLMPGIDGYEVCERLKAEHRTRHIPVIFITNAGDTDAETRGLALGAVDYITKPINPDSVRARVENHVTMKTAQDQLTRIALTDALTGLANRSCFDAMLAHEHARHARSGTDLSLILLDVDHFKRFNDTYGHVAGDECLRQVGQTIAGTVVRATDLAARFGGEEFVILLPETDLEGAVTLAEKIRQRINTRGLVHGSSPVAGHVTVSLGVATVRPRPGRSSDCLVEQADRRLYDAKGSGRDRVCSATVDYDLP